MATFSYEGRNASGQRLQGTLEAADQFEAMQQARMRVAVVESLRQHHQRTRPRVLDIQLTAPRVKPKVLAVMCSQFAIILRSGMSAVRAVGLVAEQTGDKYLREVLSAAEPAVAGGTSLADALEEAGAHLPRVFVETVRAGEESGQLAECFERLHAYFDKRSKVAGKVAGALTYPIFVAVIAVVVVAVMMIMVIPSMVGMIESLGGDVPLITQILIAASSFVSEWWPVFLGVLLLVGVAARAWVHTERSRLAWAQVKLHVPVLGPVSVCAGAAQFANTMATLLSAGLSPARAVVVTSKVLDNYALACQVGRMEVGLQEGRFLGECMEADCTDLPATLREMTAVGESTGSLEETLAIMGEFYDSETQRLTDHVLSLLEPAMLVLMAAFAGFIVIALYLPMFAMYGSI